MEGYILELDLNNGLFTSLAEGDAIFFDGIRKGSKERYWYKYNSYDGNQALEFDRYDYGEWVAVTINEGCLNVKTDYFGYYRVFYHYSNGLFLISNDYAALCGYVNGDGRNADLFFPLLASSSTIFANHFSDLTPNSKVKVLGVFNEININLSSKKISVDRNNLSLAMSGGSGGSNEYLDLLESGIKKVSEEVRNLRNDGKKIVLWLSGGRDSRVCLALLLYSLGDDGFLVHTANPGDGSNLTFVNDEKVSLLIRNKFGLNVFENMGSKRFRLSSREYLDKVNGYLLCNYFGGYVDSATIELDRKEVQILGGGGECLRPSSFFKNYVDSYKVCNTSESVKDDISHMFKNLIELELLDNTERAEEFFVDFFDNEIPGSTFEEKMEWRYIFERNNRHFGNHRKKYTEGKSVFYPLSNHSFFKASRLLSFDERLNRKVGDDIIRMCGYGNLLDIPYSDDEAVVSSTVDRFSHPEPDSKKRCDEIITSKFRSQGRDLKSHMKFTASSEISRFFEEVDYENHRLLNHVESRLGSKRKLLFQFYGKCQTFSASLGGQADSYIVYKA